MNIIIWLKKSLIHLLFISAALIIIFLPLFRQISFSPPGTFYTRIHGIFADYYGYLMVIKQGRTQSVEINQFSTEEAPPSRQHLFYLLLGRIAETFNISDINIYYLAIIISFLIFYTYANLLIDKTINKKFHLLARFIIFFASPFPQITLNLFNRQIFLGTHSFWTWMDPYTRLMIVPHHYFSVALMLGATFHFLDYFSKKKVWSLFWCILLVIPGTIFFPVPMFIFTLAVVIILLSKIVSFLLHKDIPGEKNLLLGLFLIILSFAGASLYVYSQISSGYPWSQFANIEYTTYREERPLFNFTTFLLSYGILLFFIPIALVRTIRKKRFEHIFLLEMAVIPLILYHLSVWGIIHISKLRFVYAAPYVFAGLLATIGVVYLLSCLHSALVRKLVYAVVITMFMVNSFLGFKSYWWPKLFEKNLYGNFYLSDDQLTAFSYLKKHSPPYSNVLSNHGHGMYIPAFTHNKVYVGHELATLNFWEKNYQADKFFANNMSFEEARLLFTLNRIFYVYWDNLSFGQPTETYMKLMQEVFNSNTITIYKTYLFFNH